MTINIVRKIDKYCRYLLPRRFLQQFLFKIIEQLLKLNSHVFAEKGYIIYPPILEMGRGALKTIFNFYVLAEGDMIVEQV